MPAKAKMVGLFVDWNSLLLGVPNDLQSNPDLASRHAINSVGKVVGKKLCSMDRDITYRVRIRLYHGWTAGVTPTANQRAITRMPEYLNPDEIFGSTRVLSLADIEFGDRLIDAPADRLNLGLGIHLPNTFRKQRSDMPPGEKMVDTALAADLLTWARFEPDSIALVLSSDDDVVPPLFVAEAWMKPYGGIVMLKRPRPRSESRYLSLAGLLI